MYTPANLPAARDFIVYEKVTRGKYLAYFASPHHGTIFLGTITKHQNYWELISEDESHSVGSDTRAWAAETMADLFLRAKRKEIEATLPKNGWVGSGDHLLVKPRTDLTLTAEQANKVFNLLVEGFGADEGLRGRFVQTSTDPQGAVENPHVIEFECGFGKFEQTRHFFRLTNYWPVGNGLVAYKVAWTDAALYRLYHKWFG